MDLNKSPYTVWLASNTGMENVPIFLKNRTRGKPETILQTDGYIPLPPLDNLHGINETLVIALTCRSLATRPLLPVDLIEATEVSRPFWIRFAFRSGGQEKSQLSWGSWEVFVGLRIDSIVWSRNGKGRASLNIIYTSKSKQRWWNSLKFG